MELTVLVLLVFGMLAYSFGALFGPWRPLTEEGTDTQRRIAVLEVEKTSNLQAIKDVDFERATGKLSDEDYEDLRSFYTRQAAESIQALKAFQSEQALEALQSEAGDDDPSS